VNDNVHESFPYEEDPLSILLRKTRTLDWRVYRHHWAGRVIGVNGLTGDIESRIRYDDHWLCTGCRPYKEEKEGGRITTAFEDHDCWLTIADTDDRRKVADTARGLDICFVAVPVFRGGLAVLTTGPLSGESVDVSLYPIVSLVMKLRDVGRLSSTQGFLPAARKFDYWEAHHPATNRRCWHLHDTEPGARACASATGEELDGSPKGWYIRGTTPLRQLGRIDAHADGLRAALDRLRVKSWLQQDADSDQAKVVFGPVKWNDKRFVQLRDDLGWKPPGWADEDWSPPDYAFTVTVTVDGEMVLALEGRK